MEGMNKGRISKEITYLYEQCGKNKRKPIRKNKHLD
jgi:hypothetical protein